MRVRTALPALLLVVAILTGLWPAAPASAHVLLAKAQPNGDGTTTLTFTFDHGCGTAPTTELTVTMADGVIAGSATAPDGWSAEVAPSRVRWSGPGIDAAEEAEFSLVARISGVVGQTLWFPTEQRCDGGGSYQWTGTEPGAEEPAPSLITTGAVLAPAPAPAARSGPESGSGGAGAGQVGIGIAAATVFAAGLGLALGRRRRADEEG
ncbi:DUF1775 domain-containing protein [Solwaraspora sp. WMMD1047]|uniref:DUF1775 domain-containing protein n=1 Tax=Solwaraspora sp. WMMD1047 TaxID=3016102 RepID=UPI002416386D|nr:DUF1775 domain-containing protein [Solwaraspora sp. WMMD1047]MDG4828620.1 DUF1775 domain-containing protein [Solwaraspora sp. WMMD1047]